jgi:hypothetical protein
MKRCPQCNRVESDDSLAFCRVDGTTLVHDSLNEDSGTIRFNSASVSGEAQTSVLPPAVPDPGFRPVQQTKIVPTQVTNENIRPLKRKPGRLIVALVAAFAIIETALRKQGS